MAVIKVKAMESNKLNVPKSKQKQTDDKKTLIIAQELKIARSLAGNEKVTRDRALKSLKKWFQRRSENLAYTEEDFLRIWKGLFYSMWMSDKPLIQEECAESIASLLHELPLEHSLILFKCGLLTLCKEWFGLDQLRLDKFLMFVRRLLRQALVVLKKSGFQKDHIVEFGNIISETVLNTERKDILGLFMHFTEIFLEELAKVSEGNIKPHLVTEFLIPFIKTLAVTDDPRRIKQIKKCIFEHLMRQSDIGLEYQERYEAWKKMGFPGTIHAVQKVEVEEETNGEVDSEEEFHSKILDPRAGRVDVELPQIKFNPKALAELLIKHKFSERSKVPAKKMMTALSKQLKKLSKGIYPLGVTDLRLPKQDDTNIRKAVNRLVKFEKKLMKDKTKSKKRKISKDDLEPVKKKIKLDNNQNDSQAVKKLDITEIPKKYLKKGILFKSESENIKEAIPDCLLSESGELPELVFEKFSGLWKVYDDSQKVPDKRSKIKSTKKKSGIQKKKADKLEKGELFKKSPWDEPLKEGEYEVTVPSKSYVEKLKKISKKSSKNLQELIDNSLVKFRTPAELVRNAQCSTPERAKKVKINTSLNQSQDFEEYHTQILTSSAIVFDANKKPGKPLLKSRNTTPIDPFYAKYEP